MDSEDQTMSLDKAPKPTLKRPGLRIKQCRKYISSEIVELFRHELQPWRGMSFSETREYEKMRKLEQDGLRPGNYSKYFSFVMAAEEFSMEMRMGMFDMMQVSLSYAPLDQTFYYLLCVPGIIDKSPNVVKGNTLTVCTGPYTIDMKVEVVMKQEVYLKPLYPIDKFFQQIFDGSTKKTVICNVHFHLNRWNFICVESALSVLTYEVLEKIFPQPGSCLHPAPHHKVPTSKEPTSNHHGKPKKANKCKPTKPDVDLFNKSLAGNAEQIQAIKNIMNGSAHPFPFILFGPPGTGKSVTIVEAIKQVWKKNSNSRIVVAAPSNTATDHLAKLLLQDVPDHELLRLFAPSRKGEPVHPKLENVCKYGNQSPASLSNYRIICATLVTCHRLALSGMKHGFYTHFFIDEAAQASEPEALIPLAGLWGKGSHIILSGDPHQLGPVVFSPIAQRFGLELSLIERLFKTDMYNSRNPRYVIKLVRNFRSHPALLKIPNELFYNNELEPCADPKIVNQYTAEKYEWITKKGFPLMFVGICNKHKFGEFSPSLMNIKEAEFVIYFVKKILEQGKRQEDIGIITPYRRQVRLIRERLCSSRDFKNQKLDKVLVGSTEEFQGQEKPVMILSTVRSSLISQSVGFLSNQKRFNVAVTRAQAMLIIIGDPYLLWQDETWRCMVKYCIDYGGYSGCTIDKRTGKKPT